MDALEPAGPAAIAERATLHSEIWVAIAFREGEFAAALPSLIEEIAAADVPRDCSVVTAPSATDLVETINAQPKNSVFLVTGVETFSQAEVQALDRKRNALLGRTVLFCTSLDGLTKLASFAPNIFSWLAGQCLEFDALEGVMNVEERLESLRKHYSLSDADVVDLAAQGRLPTEPAFVEWLTLLGRGDLLGA